MIRILDRLVGFTFLRIFVSFALGAPILFILGDLTENLDTFLERELAVSEIVLAYLFQLPNYVIWSFPIAGLVASVFTIHSMTVNHEIVAAKGGGISFHRLMLPLVVVGVGLMSVALVTRDLVPKSNQRAAEIRQERQGLRDYRVNFVYQTENGRTLTVRRLMVGAGSMSDVVLEAPGPDPEWGMTHVFARQAYWDRVMGWTLHDGYFRRVRPDGGSLTYRFDRMLARDLEESPEDLLEEPRPEEQLTYAELGRLADAIRRSGGNPNELLVEQENKNAIPVATLIIILFGAPLATTVKRGGAAIGVGISLGSTIVYLVLMRVSAALGVAGVLTPVVAAWIPNGLFLAAASVLLLRVRT